MSLVGLSQNGALTLAKCLGTPDSGAILKMSSATPAAVVE